LVASQLFGTAVMCSPLSLFLRMGGGFVFGFRTRYADGCSSGHGIAGLAHAS